MPRTLPRSEVISCNQAIVLMHMIEISWALSVPKATSLRQQCWPSRCELPSVLSRRSRCRGASDSTDAGHRRVLERSICGGVPLEPRVESIYGLKDALDGGGTLVLKGAAMKLTSPSLSNARLVAAAVGLTSIVAVPLGFVTLV